MPRLSVWIVRTSLIYLGFGFTFGALMLWNKGEPFSGAAWRLLPAHIEFLLIGWVVQFAIGVAFWILPRFGNVRRNEGLVLGTYLALNLGVLASGIGQWLNAPALVVILGRAFEVLGVALFLLHAWPRIKPFGK